MIDSARSKPGDSGKAIAFLLFITSIPILLAAYIPIGYMAPLVGIELAWSELIKSNPIILKIWYDWLIVAAIVGNLQIPLCFASICKPNKYLQNSMLKMAATFGQLSWIQYGYTFYPWYFWIIGSSLLFAVTPKEDMFEDKRNMQFRKWQDSRLLENLTKISQHAKR